MPPGLQPLINLPRPSRLRRRLIRHVWLPLPGPFRPGCARNSRRAISRWKIASRPVHSNRSVMTLAARRGFVALLVAVALSGCSTVPPAEQLASTLRGTTLDDAEKLLMYAQRSPANPETAAVCRIRAAEIAWNDLAATRGSVVAVTSLSAEKQRAVRLYNEATAELALLVIRDAG